MKNILLCKMQATRKFLLGEDKSYGRNVSKLGRDFRPVLNFS